MWCEIRTRSLHESMRGTGASGSGCTERGSSPCHGRVRRPTPSTTRVAILGSNGRVSTTAAKSEGVWLQLHGGATRTRPADFASTSQQLISLDCPQQQADSLQQSLALDGTVIGMRAKHTPSVQKTTHTYARNAATTGGF